MKNKLRRNLQSLQDAYASLCGLTIIITDQADKRITEPSGLTEMASLLFGSPCATAEHAIANLLEKVRNVSKTIVYETRSGLKMLITSIGICKQRPYYILTGVWVDGCTKELITGRIHETVPPENARTGFRLWIRYRYWIRRASPGLSANWIYWLIPCRLCLNGSRAENILRMTCSL